jgi:hypothetical protein
MWAMGEQVSTLLNLISGCSDSLYFKPGAATEYISHGLFSTWWSRGRDIVSEVFFTVSVGE